MLRGTVAALETQLSSVRTACTAAEAASQRATAETVTLQSELEKVRNHASYFDLSMLLFACAAFGPLHSSVYVKKATGMAVLSVSEMH